MCRSLLAELEAWLRLRFRIWSRQGLGLQQEVRYAYGDHRASPKFCLAEVGSLEDSNSRVVMELGWGQVLD